ncbi:class I SAM-dependent methyltransferase [Acetobacter sp. AN02]|uniref:class I SAM-dependent methyltransferase n=1 Tax=Acetobacter sp. AN02 TaxID=2894186 RepID=UPI0024345D84|nr:class I SAM-dependent methyltransferase [Acetobacter sp. AN02]MDG6093619.1 class I SAM-dependent methyltransferase [Acetobacter sp. AN02]
MTEFFSGAFTPDENGVLHCGTAAPPAHHYSDGDETETRLLTAVRNAKDRSLFSSELRGAVTDWPSLYHLSPSRANLLRPFAGFLATRTILEPGAGCGAISRFLGEITAGQGGKVVSVESSSRRAAIARARTEEFPQMDVIAGDLLQLEPIQKFDAVVLVGVLEYARLFGAQEADPVAAFLAYLRRFLKPDGVLFLAIENQTGLKYLAGEKEDHLGIPWFGINDLYTARTAVTFGRAELTQALTQAGLGITEPWMPFPDYKLPALVLPPRAAGQSGFLAGHLIAETGECERRPSFSPQKAWPVMARNGLLQDVTNSFLMLASGSALPADIADPSVLAWHYATGRAQPYVKETRFLTQEDDILVERHPLAPASASSATRSDSPFAWTCEAGREVYHAQPCWWFRLLDILSREGWTLDTLEEWADIWLRAWLNRADADHLTADMKVTGDLVDATPFNLIVPQDGSTPLFFDLEWQAEAPVEAMFIIVRGLRESIRKITLPAPPADRTLSTPDRIILRLLERFDLKLTQADLDRYSEQEAAFQVMVNDGPYPLNTAERVRFNDFPLRWYEPLSDGASIEARTQLELRIVEMQRLVQERDQALSAALSDSDAQRQRADHLEQENRIIRDSTIWRAGSGLRRIARRCPRAAEILKRIIRRARPR